MHVICICEDNMLHVWRVPEFGGDRQGRGQVVLQPQDGVAHGHLFVGVWVGEHLYCVASVRSHGICPGGSRTHKDIHAPLRASISVGRNDTCLEGLEGVAFRGDGRPDADVHGGGACSIYVEGGMKFCVYGCVMVNKGTHP
jgi:hypothetical protein